MKSKIICQRMGHWVKGLSFALVGLAVIGTSSANIDIARLPLHLTSSVDPNIVFVLDDSGSMHWEVTPDEAIGNTGYYMFPRVAGNYGGGDYNNRVPSFRSEVGDGSTAAERAFAAMMRSHQINKSYYNPAVTYKPWAKPAGMAISATPPVVTSKSEFEPASITAAPHHPIRDTGVRNLTVTNSAGPTWVYCSNYNGGVEWTSCNAQTQNRNFFPAVYFRYDGGAVNDRASYTRIEIRPEASRPAPFTGQPYSGEGRTSRTDCAQSSSGICTYAEEIQNFANWYTYYRSRMLSAQAGIGRAFVDQSEKMRVGFGAINKGATTIDGRSNTSTIIRGVRPFTGADRNEFFDQLYTGDWLPNNTPLRKALNDVGLYYSWGDDRGPWGARPGFSDTTSHLACRQSFTILMTDGYWNTGLSPASTSAARANVDGNSGPIINGPDSKTYQYTSVTPFTDSHADTLADVAMYYWNRDLRTDLANEVPVANEKRNPAFWQHMVTYGVGLGVSGSINPDDAFNAIGADPPVTITWPDPTSSNAAKLDDLLHAGVNSRGGFFSAADPKAFADKLTSVIQDILARVAGASTSSAASAAVVQAESLVYGTRYRSSDWSGTIRAYELDEDGNILPAVKWDAEVKLDAMSEASRKIFTLDEDGNKIPLEDGSLSAAQKTALQVDPPGATATGVASADRVKWLRGTDHAALRSRSYTGENNTDGDPAPVTRKLGDIISSDPQLVGRIDYSYDLYPGPDGAKYKEFLASSTFKNRPDVLYVGANDGMLHAFHGGTPFVGPAGSKTMQANAGKELFAYMPSELLLPNKGTADTHAQINELMRKDYSHRYFVNGTPHISDAYWDGSWKTVLIGTMGAGGRTVFALDVTDPESFTASKVLWEFTYAANACVADPTGANGSKACRDVGYGITRPKIVRLKPTALGQAGRWVAVFGNGYNSHDHRAKLFVVDIKTGSLLYLLDTGAGSSASASTKNGLGVPETTDWPSNDLNLRRAYAGDLLGNMWRFDFSTTTPTVQRLFTATDATGKTQPITSKPRVALRPKSNNQQIVVMVGTGSYFRVDDDDMQNPQPQTVYGVFDGGSSPVTNVIRSQLLQQVASQNTSTVSIDGVSYPAGSLRRLTKNEIQPTHRGWYFDLPVSGERMISEGQFPSGSEQPTIVFASLIPDPDPCASRRRSFFMNISVANGGDYGKPRTDLNNDGDISDKDLDSGGNSWAGIENKSGVGESPQMQRGGKGNTDEPKGGDLKRLPSVQNTAGPIGRQSWRQLR